MKCPNCGRENPDIRLFCMSCGELLPETEDANVSDTVHEAMDDISNMHAFQRSNSEPVADPLVFNELSNSGSNHSNNDELQNVGAFAHNLPDPESADTDSEEASADDTEFYKKRERSRGFVEEAWPEENIPKSVEKPSIFDEKPATKPSSDSPYARPTYDPAPSKPALNRRKAPDIGSDTSTIIPRRNDELEPDDFFAVRGQVLPEYDEYSDEPGRRGAASFEDEVHQSFAVRHMRGIVTLLLLVLTFGIVLIWANTESAQRALAQVFIAWKPEAYATLGDEAYAINDLDAAGNYYNEALKRDDDNYAYAVKAANAYIEGGYTSNALKALRNCIALRPSEVDPYIMLLNLQPDANNIPESDLKLLEQGYKLTGDTRLNIE